MCFKEGPVASVTICTPHAGGVRPDFYRALFVMQNAFRQHAFFHMEVDLMIVGKARNVITEGILATQNPQPDVLWYIDDDVKVPEQSGVLIEQAMEYGIVSGLYFNRHQPYTPQMYKLSSYAGEEGMYEPIADYPDEGLMVVDAVGAGCLAVRRDVLTTMKEKHLEHLKAAEEAIRYQLRNDGRERAEFEWLMTYAHTLSPWFEFLDQKGEDFYFCERARESGFMTMVNPGVKCGHMGEIEIAEAHFKYLKDNNLYFRVAPDGTVRDLKGNIVPPPAPPAVQPQEALA